MTPKVGVLEGITRRTVLEIAQAQGLPVEVRALASAELRTADEAFLTSSGGGVLPITQVDGRPLAGGRIGAVTQRLAETYWAWHRDPRYSTPVGYALASVLFVIYVDKAGGYVEKSLAVRH